MSEGDPSEPRTRKRRKSRRRSLRVPVDEVPRPTQSADAGEGADDGGDDGGSTMEIPAFDEARATLEQIERAASGHEESVEEDLPPESEEVALESVETDALALEEEPASRANGKIESAPPPAARDDGDTVEAAALPEELLGAPRDDVGGEEPLTSDATVVQEPPSELPALAGQADALTEEAPSLELVITDDEDEDRDEEPAAGRRTDPDPQPEAPKPPVGGVVVQRVVAIVSAPRSTPPPEPEPEPFATDTVPGAEVAIDFDEPELRIAEPAEMDELDVDIDEGDRPSAPELEPEALLEEAEPRDSAPELEELLVDGERRDSAPELEDAEELLEEEARAELDGAQKKPSKRPPPPPSNKAAKDAPPPPPEPEAPKPAAAPRRKKPRKAWYEELFNDDYLRTVPIPHPRVIQRQCDFIEQRFGLAQGATILDVGCGLGLHAVELTRRGYLVVGLDLSLPMLSRAADEAQDHGFKINFLHADMREMNFDGAFDAVLCYGTTFGYFDDDSNRLVVERLLKALKPRGLLLLDVVNRDYLIRSQPNLVWFEGDGCVVMEESRMNYITSRLEVKRTVILDDGRQRENVYSLRTYSLHELGQILHHQGFRVVEVTGWEAHPGVFFGADSPKLIILAERRPAGPPTVPGRSSISGEMQAVSGSEPAPPHSGEGELEEETPEPVVAAPPEERPEPSAAVSEALAETLEKSGELDVPEEELVEDDLEDE